MLFTTCATISRIVANSALNAEQKKLSEISTSLNTNFNTYFLLAVFCLPLLLIQYGSVVFDGNVMLWAFVGGIFGALGNACLIAALKRGELSILGPINSYKSVVSLVFVLFVLKEIPNIFSFFGIILIILGSYFVFETTKEGFSFKIFTRQEIRLRVYALILTALEAVFIKKVIILTDALCSFYLWVVFGCLFSFVFLKLAKEKPVLDFRAFLPPALLVLIMQGSTNYVFSKIPVAPALALFQLSAVLNVLLGWKIFNEKNILKKLIGSIIMVIGSVIIILKT